MNYFKNQTNYVMSFNGKTISVKSIDGQKFINDIKVSDEAYDDAVRVINKDGDILTKIKSVNNILEEYQEEQAQLKEAKNLNMTAQKFAESFNKLWNDPEYQDLLKCLGVKR